CLRACRCLPAVPVTFFFQRSGAPPDLPSFPTRRSSDLGGKAPLGGEREREEQRQAERRRDEQPGIALLVAVRVDQEDAGDRAQRSEEHTSELQSLTNIVCRLLLEKKKTTTTYRTQLPHN